MTADERAFADGIGPGGLDTDGVLGVHAAVARRLGGAWPVIG